MQSVDNIICCKSSSLVCDFAGDHACPSRAVQEVVKGHEICYSGRAGPWMKTSNKYKIVIVAKCDSKCEGGS